MARTEQAAAFVLHSTQIGKGALKKFGISFPMAQCIFMLVILNLSSRKRRAECSAPLGIAQRVSYQSWLETDRFLSEKSA
jgi:hypothetical protein